MLEKWHEPNSRARAAPLTASTTSSQRSHWTNVWGPSAMTREKGVPERLKGLHTVIGLWQHQRKGGRDGSLHTSSLCWENQRPSLPGPGIPPAQTPPWPCPVPTTDQPWAPIHKLPADPAQPSSSESWVTHKQSRCGVPGPQATPGPGARGVSSGGLVTRAQLSLRF